MFVFGGIDQYQERFNDLFEYCFFTNSWHWVLTCGISPTPRTFHQAVYCTGSIYILGGFDGWKRNDMFKIVVDDSGIGLDDNNDQIDKNFKRVFTSEYFE